MIKRWFRWFDAPKPQAISQKWFDGELGKELREVVTDPFSVDTLSETDSRTQPDF